MALSADLFGNIGDAASGIFSGIGNVKAADAYGQAADIALQNAQLAQTSSRIQVTQAERQVYQGIGGQKSDVAAAGFAAGGSGLDLLRSSVQQGGLQNQLLKVQGLINENSYKAEAAGYKAQQSSAKAAAGGGFFKAALSIASAALPFLSDDDAKQDIGLLRPSHIDGINIYLFRYIGLPDVYQGVLASEVEKVRPDAVLVDEDGVRSVDYDALGIRFHKVV